MKKCIGRWVTTGASRTPANPANRKPCGSPGQERESPMRRHLIDHRIRLCCHRVTSSGLVDENDPLVKVGWDFLPGVTPKTFWQVFQNSTRTQRIQFACHRGTNEATWHVKVDR